MDLGGFIAPPCETQTPFDLIVVGLQEIGSSGNREQWSTALQIHLNLAYEGRWTYVRAGHCYAGKNECLLPLLQL